MVIYIYIYIYRERERERERERDHEGRTKKWTHPHVNNSFDVHFLVLVSSLFWLYYYSQIYNVDKCVNFKLEWMKIFDIKPK